MRTYESVDALHCYEHEMDVEMFWDGVVVDLWTALYCAPQSHLIDTQNGFVSLDVYLASLPKTAPPSDDDIPF